MTPFGPAIYLVFALGSSAGASDQHWIGPAEGAGATRKLELKSLLAQHPLAPEENIKLLPVFRNERTATVLVQVRDREPMHYHADSDISVLLIRGRGTIVIGKQRHKLEAGDTLFIPRGVEHAYLNEGEDVGAALVIFSPPPGPKDRVLTETAEK